jgi:hypothetical protein
VHAEVDPAGAGHRDRERRDHDDGDPGRAAAQEARRHEGQRPEDDRGVEGVARGQGEAGDLDQVPGLGRSRPRVAELETQVEQPARGRRARHQRSLDTVPAPQEGGGGEQGQHAEDQHPARDVEHLGDGGQPGRPVVQGCAPHGGVEPGRAAARVVDAVAERRLDPEQEHRDAQGREHPVAGRRVGEPAPAHGLGVHHRRRPAQGEHRRHPLASVREHRPTMPGRPCEDAEEEVRSAGTAAAPTTAVATARRPPPT